jgi:hypothetical protein
LFCRSRTRSLRCCLSFGLRCLPSSFRTGVAPIFYLSLPTTQKTPPRPLALRPSKRACPLPLLLPFLLITLFSLSK